MTLDTLHKPHIENQIAKIKKKTICVPSNTMHIGVYVFDSLLYFCKRSALQL